MQAEWDWGSWGSKFTRVACIVHKSGGSRSSSGFDRTFPKTE